MTRIEREDGTVVFVSRDGIEFEESYLCEDHEADVIRQKNIEKASVLRADIGGFEWLSILFFIESEKDCLWFSVKNDDDLRLIHEAYGSGYAEMEDFEDFVRYIEPRYPDYICLEEHVNAPEFPAFFSLNNLSAKVEAFKKRIRE